MDNALEMGVLKRFADGRDPAEDMFHADLSKVYHSPKNGSLDILHHKKGVTAGGLA